MRVSRLSLTDRAAALAGGYLATGLSRSISNALQLDEFEIQAGEQGFGPTLSVGQQVGEHFFFRVRQGFGDAQATELILEYQLEGPSPRSGSGSRDRRRAARAIQTHRACGPRFDLLFLLLVVSGRPCCILGQSHGRN